jgi:hypothetical protein
MKTESVIAQRFHYSTGLLLLCSCFLIGGAASAQNLVKNPGFESPIGTNASGNIWGGANFPLGTTTGGEVYDPSWTATWNWMIAYPWGGPDDFEIRDRDTTVKSGLFSACFRPAHDKWAHACYTQTITNLEAGHAYTVSGWMMEDFWKGVADAKRGEYLVYLEAIGARGTPTPDGRASVLAVATDQSNLDAPYTYPSTSWLQFTNQQTPAANGTIEIRLHLNKISWCLSDKLIVMNGYFDDVSLTY